MARKVNDIVPTGSGIRVTWDNNSIDDLAWMFINNRLTLTKNGTLCPGDLVNEIIESINMCNRGTALWTHIFGVAADHMSARAVGQISDTLAISTWARLIWDVVEEETQNTAGSGDTQLGIDGAGIITIPRGEFMVSYEAMMHDTSTSIPHIALHILDVDAGIEIPFSFSVDTKLALANGPFSKRGSTFIVNDYAARRISIEVRSTLATTMLGYHASSVPVGSQNQAGTLTITRNG